MKSFAALGLILAVPAAAQQAQPKAWTLGIGVAPVVGPAWQGSRDTALSIFPDVRLNYKDSVFLSVPDGLGWNAINQDGWKLGPLAKVRFGRRESTGGSPFLIAGGSDALRGFGDIGIAGELGGFAQKAFLKNRLRLRAELRQGFGGHDGLVADTSVTWSDRRRDGKLLWNIGVRASFADADFTNTYFGVTNAQALAAGLPAFRTGSGLVSAGVNASLIKPLGPRGRDGALTLFTSYDRLGDVVADSTLIRERGDRNQLTVGLGYLYRFSF